jgi:hypothetical protein
MGYIRLSKPDLINIIRRERLLGSGSWARGPWNAKTKIAALERTYGCQVCAVGSVLRWLLSPTETVANLAQVAIKNMEGMAAESRARCPLETIERECQERIDKKAWLACISWRFENVAEGESDHVEDRRVRTIQMIERLFPREVMIDIGKCRLLIPGLRIKSRRKSAEE